MDWSYQWLLGQPPGPITWFVGLLAVAGMLTLPQVIWGRAQLQTEYETVADDEDRSLIVFSKESPS
jgi:hypothetical protein